MKDIAKHTLIRSCFGLQRNHIYIDVDSISVLS